MYHMPTSIGFIIRTLTVYFITNRIVSVIVVVMIIIIESISLASIQRYADEFSVL